MKGVTYTTIVATDGEHSTYATYRVRTRKALGEIKKLNLEKAEIVATETVSTYAYLHKEARRVFCYQTSMRHALPEWPAFEWGAK